MLPSREALDVVCVTPLDKEAILVAHDSVVQVVDMNGQATKTRSMKSSAPIKFSFRIEAISKLFVDRLLIATPLFISVVLRSVFIGQHFSVPSSRHAGSFAS